MNAWFAARVLRRIVVLIAQGALVVEDTVVAIARSLGYHPAARRAEMAIASVARRYEGGRPKPIPGDAVARSSVRRSSQRREHDSLVRCD
jgi:hypothetical protein